MSTVSIWYLFTGKPHTNEDFLNYAQTKGNNKANIQIESGGNLEKRHKIYLQTGDLNVRLSTFWSYTSPFGSLGLCEFKAYALAWEYIACFVDFFENNGVTTTVNGKPKDIIYDEVKRLTKETEMKGLLMKLVGAE